MISSNFRILLTKSCFTRFNYIKQDFQLNKICRNFSYKHARRHKAKLEIKLAFLCEKHTKIIL